MNWIYNRYREFTHWRTLGNSLFLYKSTLKIPLAVLYAVVMFIVLVHPFTGMVGPQRVICLYFSAICFVIALLIYVVRCPPWFKKDWFEWIQNYELRHLLREWCTEQAPTLVRDQSVTNTPGAAGWFRAVDYVPNSLEQDVADRIGQFQVPGHYPIPVQGSRDIYRALCIATAHSRPIARAFVGILLFIAFLLVITPIFVTVWEYFGILFSQVANVEPPR